jgi:pimeloyl-ACP methyl ester carboxylesterase
MQRRMGHIAVESVAAETSKFTAPMVLIHGLWCSASMWRPFTGYFAHHGWVCHALTLRGGAQSRTAVAPARFADYLDDVHRVLAACEAAPVVVGHDLGGLLALQRAAPSPRAVVAVAPLLPRSLAMTSRSPFTGLGARLAMWRSRPLPVPRGRIGAEYFATGPPGGTTADSSRLGRELAQSELPLAFNEQTPTLIVAGERDPFCSPLDAERLAMRVQATFQCVPGVGHALPWAPGWEQRVSEIHRWLIRTLGESLLVTRAEE